MRPVEVLECRRPVAPVRVRTWSEEAGGDVLAWVCSTDGEGRRPGCVFRGVRLAGPASTRPPELKPSPMNATDWATVIRVELRR